MSDHSRPPVFIWLEGQGDNLGDSLLRRAYGNALREVGPLHVWAGRRNDYRSGLGLLPGDKSYGSYLAWITKAYWLVGRRHAVVALNAGEFVMSKRYGAELLGILPLVALARVLRRPVIWAGAGIPRQRPTAARVFRLLALLSSRVWWRDAVTSRQVALAATMPDWGFASASQPPDESERDALGLVMRGDRTWPSDRWLQSIADAAERLGLRPVVIVQVQRDEVRARELAVRLGAEMVAWAGGDHLSEEARVRSAYRRCRIVIGDRLHALIVAASEGAVPLGWCEAANEKILRHFSVVDAAWVAPAGDPASQLSSLDPDVVRELLDATHLMMKRARDELASVGATIQLVASRPA